MKTIGRVEDDVHIGNMLEESLQKAGYRTLRAYSGTEALYMLDHHRPDLILLDLMLPGLSGEEVLRHVKDIPIIVVSAKIDLDDKVQVLLAGAADYITKPFHIQELLARVTVQLRKPASSDPLLRQGDFCLDPLSREVSVKEQPLRLTPTEYAILKVLLRHSNQAVSKSVILDEISMDTPDCTDHSLKQHVSNLRKKLREASGKDYIEAVWGIGFRLSPS